MRPRRSEAFDFDENVVRYAIEIWNNDVDREDAGNQVRCFRPGAEMDDEFEPKSD